MRINYGDESVELNQENCYVVSYDNDMLDGVLIDLDDNFAFISAHTSGYDGVLEELDELGVGYYAVEGEPDFEQAPHSWVLKSVANLIVKDAEDTIDH